MTPSWPPEGAELVMEVTVLGEPKPAGSKDSRIVTRFDPKQGRRVPVFGENGLPKTYTADSSGKAGKSWRGDIRDAVSDVWDGDRELLDGPLALELVFYRERTKAHYGTGRNERVLKPTAPAYPHATRLPDGTKLARAFEDALNKVVWTDDRRICACLWLRDFGRDRVECRLFRLPDVAGLRGAEEDVGEGAQATLLEPVAA